MNKCSKCDAEILWVRTERGAFMPLSVASKEKRVVVTEMHQLLPGRGPVGLVRDTYISHFADCPEAESFRRRSQEEVKP